MHRAPALGTVPNGCEQRAVPQYGLMAVHAGLRGRQVHDARNLYRGVAVPAVEPKLADVEPMTVRDGLSGAIADVCVPRRKVVPDACDGDRRTEGTHDSGHERELVPPPGKNLAQWLGLPGAGGQLRRPPVRDGTVVTHVRAARN